MIFSVINKLELFLRGIQSQKRLLTSFQYLVVILSLVLLFTQHHNTLTEASFLKLQYIPLFALILLLGLINLLVETKIWMILLRNCGSLSSFEIFRAVALSYTLKSISTQYIGSLLAKQHLFGLAKWKENIKKHIRFGGFQTISTILISILLIIFLSDLKLLSIASGWSMNWIGYASIGLLAIATLILMFQVIVLRSQIKDQLNIFVLTSLRAIIYFLQFGILLFYFFDLEYFTMAISVIAIYFILKTFLPVFSIFGGIGLRELALIGTFGFFGFETVSIPVIGILIWFANFLFPVMIGGYVLLKKQVWSPLTISSH